VSPTREVAARTRESNGRTRARVISQSAARLAVFMLKSRPTAVVVASTSSARSTASDGVPRTFGGTRSCAAFREKDCRRHLQPVEQHSAGGHQSVPSTRLHHSDGRQQPLACGRRHAGPVTHVNERARPGPRLTRPSCHPRERLRNRPAARRLRRRRWSFLHAGRILCKQCRDRGVDRGFELGGLGVDRLIDPHAQQPATGAGLEQRDHQGAY